MSFASRFITALVGLALIFLFWPLGMPVGFQQTWWAREQVISVAPPPARGPAPSKPLFTQPAATEPPRAAPPKPAAATKAEAPKPKPKVQPQAEKQEAAGADQTAALKKPDEVAIAPPAKPALYYRVVVRDGGTLESNGTVITLGGIHARDAEAECKDGQGRAWPCGARARAALTRLIRGRAVSCKLPATATGKTITARCTVGGTDLSAWMVAQGWAKPAAPAEPALAKAEAAARKKKIGLWR